MAAAPLVLAVDTAGPHISLALVQGEHLLGESIQASSASYLKVLVPSIDRLLTDSGKNLSDVDLLAVSNGPGYLTGLRIGLATVKGLALALNRPVAAVSSLDIVAAGLPASRLPVAVVLDAKKREVFAAFYDRGPGDPQLRGDYLLLPPADLAGRITSPTLLTGWGLLPYGNLLLELLGAHAVLAPPEFWPGRASVLARLARGQEAAGRLNPMDRLSPLYLRPAAAEFSTTRPAKQKH